MAEYIERDAALNASKIVYIEYIEVDGDGYEDGNADDIPVVFKKDIEAIPAADVVPVPDGGIGEISDGYHTFNGLYYQRMVLFAALVKAHKDKAWKSRKHEDGELCFGGGWFIVGIDTPEGSYTYHYEGKDWDLFDCVELPVAKHWDGHTEKDVTRLLSLDGAPVRGRWVSLLPYTHHQPPDYVCSVCNESQIRKTNFCPNCGADMREVNDG